MTLENILAILIFSLLIIHIFLISILIRYLAKNNQPNKKEKEKKGDTKKVKKASNSLAIFKKYYKKTIRISVLKCNKHYKAITAAYLFVLSDYILMSNGNINKRNKNASNIFSYLESKRLTPFELKVFDEATDLFGAVIRGHLTVRGDWCFFDGKSDNPIHRMFLCLGDLILYPDHLKDYENSRIVIHPINKLISFTKQFNSILKITGLYISDISPEINL